MTLATVTSNDKVCRSHTFTPVHAQAIRIRATAALGLARLTEIEAWEAEGDTLVLRTPTIPTGPARR